MKTLQHIFGRQIFIYMLLIIIAACTVQWDQVKEKRRNYLLGIFYNGNFQNCRDGEGYVSYMRRVHPTDTRYESYLKACPQL